jgi:hypothetical protein
MVEDQNAHADPLRHAQETPWSIRHEIARKARYPHRLELELAGRTLEVRYRRGRKYTLLGEQYSAVKSRDIFAWILQGTIRLGAVEFIEWHVDPLTDEDDFLYEMDADSAGAMAVAEAVQSVWDVAILSCYGPLLEFRLAWMLRSAARDSIWAKAAERLITAQGASRFSVLLLKAFPLEYEGRVSDAPVAFELRRRAMMRLYRRVVDVRPLPGWAGRDGWMWRPMADDVVAPAVRE